LDNRGGEILNLSFCGEVRDGLDEAERDDIATDKEMADRFRKWGVDASQVDSQGPLLISYDWNVYICNGG
jgi:hypothetical protein